MNKLMLLIMLLLTPLIASGQQMADYFSHYELTTLHVPYYAESADTKHGLTIGTDNHHFSFQLESSELRDINMLSSLSFQDAQTITYRGDLTGFPDSEVRLAIFNNELEGYIQRANARYFIERANRYDPSMPDDVYVVYQSSEKIFQTTFECPVDEKFGQGLDMVQREEPSLMDNIWNVILGGATMRELEIATDADFQFVTQAGNATTANQQILSTLNMVDGVYESQLNLTIRVVFQNAWSTPDPYVGTTTGDLLNSFRTYWNSNFTHVARDVAHLFTGKFSNQGVAYVGTICRSPAFAYGLSGRSPLNVLWIVTAHEIGHNLSAEHVDGGECANTIMNPTVSGAATRFCSVSVNQITGFVAQFGTCLSPVTTPPPTPTPTPVPPTPTPTPTPTPVPTPTPGPPTAGNISISGRLVGDNTAGITVTLMGNNGVIMNVKASPFGFFTFEGVPVGTYVIVANSRFYRFNPVTVNATDNLTGVVLVQTN